MEIVKQHNQQIAHSQTHLIELINNSTPEDMFLIISSTEIELNMQKCAESRPILNYEKSIGKMNILKAIRSAIFNTAPAFKFSEKMDLNTASLLATDILSAFRYDSFEDVLLMLRMARMGQLGSGKGRFDHDVVFNVFIPKYFEIKSEYNEQKIREKTSIRNRIEDQPIDKEAHKKNVEKIDKMLKNLAKEKQIKKQKESPIEFVDYHNRFIAQLPLLVGKLTVDELKKEMKRALAAKMQDAYKIYEAELKKRESQTKSQK